MHVGHLDGQTKVLGDLEGGSAAGLEGGSSYFLLILGIQTQCNNRGFALRRAGTEYRPASQTFCRRKVAADRPI